MRRRRTKRALVTLAAAALLVGTAVSVALAQGVDGGCHATVNGQTLDTLDIKHPLVVAEGDTVALTGAIPAGADDGPSETKISVEVVADVPVATEPGNGSSWGGTVDVPSVLTQLAPGVYKVKGTATGSGWLCTGSGYIKIEGGPWTAVAAIGAVVGVAGGIAAVGAVKPKRGQVFYEGAPPESGSASDSPARLTADAVTLILFGLLVWLMGFIGPSWVV